LFEEAFYRHGHAICKSTHGYD